MTTEHIRADAGGMPKDTAPADPAMVELEGYRNLEFAVCDMRDVSRLLLMTWESNMKRDEHGFFRMCLTAEEAEAVEFLVRDVNGRSLSLKEAWYAANEGRVA